MRIRIAAAMALAVAATAGATALATPHASALVSPVRITEVCVNGGPSNHVWVDESFTGLGPGASYHVDIVRGVVASGNELGWVADGSGNHVARTLFEITGTDTIARAGQTFHWILRQSPSGSAVLEGDATVLSGSCTLPAAPDTKITLAKIKPAKHKAKFAFSGVGVTTRFQCKLKKAHHTASFTSCTSPRVYRHLHGKYKFFVRAIGPGGTDASPATHRFRI